MSGVTVKPQADTAAATASGVVPVSADGAFIAK